MKQGGYQTAMIGKWHLGHTIEQHLPNARGFDHFYGHVNTQVDYFNHEFASGHDFQENGKIVDHKGEYATDIHGDQSVRFLTELRDKSKPFFLYVPHPQPHVPLFVSDKFRGKSNRGLYGDVIMEIDWSVGQILETLKTNGLEENTLVIFTSDNGPWLAYGNHSGSALPFREGKGTAWEGGQREPFIVKYPEKLEAGKTITTPVMAIDILPTVAEITGAELPKNIIDGKSVWKVLTGETTERPQEAYFFYYRANALHGVRYGKWKLYFPHRYRTMNGQEAGKDGLPGEYRMVDLDEIELYDVVNDVSEVNNIAAENPEVVAKIKLLADDMRSRLGDSLLKMEGSETRQAGAIDLIPIKK